VLFKKVTENTIDFDLVCFVDDIDAAGRVSSDIYFEIFRGLRKAGIGVPAPAAAAPGPDEEPQDKAQKAEEKEDEALTLLKDKTPA
jgi:potassium-dependent mechanosensitive channel